MPHTLRKRGKPQLWKGSRTVDNKLLNRSGNNRWHEHWYWHYTARQERDDHSKTHFMKDITRVRWVLWAFCSTLICIILPSHFFLWRMFYLVIGEIIVFGLILFVFILVLVSFGSSDAFRALLTRHLMIVWITGRIQWVDACLISVSVTAMMSTRWVSSWEQTKVRLWRGKVAKNRLRKFLRCLQIYIGAYIAHIKSIALISGI